MREWYILVDGQLVGPITLEALKEHPSLTPDSYIWKKGFVDWLQARYIPELNEVFKDKRMKPKWSDKDKSQLGKNEKDYLVLSLQHDPYQFFLWVLLVLLTLMYVIYRIQ